MICITYKDRSDHSLVGFSITRHIDPILDTKSVDVLHSMMLAQVTLKQDNIEQILEKILASGEITLNAQRWLISLCFESSLNYQQEHLVNKVYEALRNGLLVVVDERNR